MPIAPAVEATAISAFAPVSNAPTATTSGTDAAGRVAPCGSLRARGRARDGAEARGRRRPGCALLRGRAEADEEQAEAEGGDEREPDAGGRSRPPAPSGLPRDEHDPGEREHDAEPLHGRR